MKKYFFVFIALIMLSLVACGKQKSSDDVGYYIYTYDSVDPIIISAVVDKQGNIDENLQVDDEGNIVNQDNEIIVIAENAIDFDEYFLKKYSEFILNSEISIDENNYEKYEEFCKIENNTADLDIKLINIANTKQALAAVSAPNSDYEPIELTNSILSAGTNQGGDIEEICSVSTGGYAVKVITFGSQGKIEMVVGVDSEGVITGISIVSNAETGGIGSKVMDNKPNDAGEGVLDQFIGMRGAGSLIVNDNIIPISGATVSTKAVASGANAALAAVELLK